MIYPPFFRLDERGILFWDIFWDIFWDVLGGS